MTRNLDFVVALDECDVDLLVGAFAPDFYIDADASPYIEAEFDQNDDVRQFSQELRLSGDTRGVSWLGGLYYSWDTVNSFTPGYLVDLLQADALLTSYQKTQSEAAFGQAKWPLPDNFSLTTGLRYTRETKSYFGGTSLLVPPPITAYFPIFAILIVSAWSIRLFNPPPMKE